MKTIIACTLFSVFAFADFFKLNKIENYQDFPGIFSISSDESKNHVILDCQGFVNNMSFYQNGQKLISYVLSGYGECAAYYENINSCLNKTGVVCLNYNDIEASRCECD